MPNDFDNIFDNFDLDNVFKEKYVATTPVADSQLLLPTGKLITLNDDQFTGVNKTKQWLNSDKNFFTIAGYAGTGKSTIVKKILDNYHRGVIVSAPTHKAKKIVSNVTGREGKTMHSLLGLRPDCSIENFNPNSPEFQPIAPQKITDYNLVIIDEASMLPRKLYELLKEIISGSKTKILFVGDSAQLPPVQEVMSCVFTDKDIIVHYLTKVERQCNSNPLMPIYDALRNNLNSYDGGYNRITNINDLGEGIQFTIDKREFRKLILEKFSTDEFKKDTDFVRGLAWKNDTVMSANKVIRDELFEHTTDIIELNDVLMGYRTVTNERQIYNIIENSADYRVVDKSKLEENSYGINGYHVKLREELAHGKFKFDDVFIIDSNDHENLHLYAQMHDFFRDMGKDDKRKWKKYYEFRRCNLLMVNINKYHSGLYRSSGDVIVKDIDYGYFLTVHKSQGSTYQHVMCMENDMNDNQNIVERNKLRYVAFSRPEKSCTVLTTKLD